MTGLDATGVVISMNLNATEVSENAETFWLMDEVGQSKFAGEWRKARTSWITSIEFLKANNDKR